MKTISRHGQISGLTRSLVLSTSLVVALVSLSSCGKSKEVKSTPPATAQTTPAPAPTTPTPTLTSSQDNTLAQPDPSLNQAGPGDNRLPAPDQQQAGPGDNRLPDNGGNNNGNGGQLNPGTALNPDQQNSRGGRGGSTRNPDQQIRDGQKTPDQQVNAEKSASQINFKGIQAVKNGGQVKTKEDEAELFYTGTGDDSLTEEFKSYNGRVSPEQQKMNVNLAKAITSAKFVRPSVSSSGALTLTVDEFGTIQTYRMTAVSDGDKLKLVKSKTGTTGEMEFQGGFVKCLDISGTCETAYAKIKIAGGYIRAIFRNAEANVHYLVQDKVTGLPGFDLLARYVWNTAGAVNSVERIEKVRLSSYEIINGRAAMGALITTENREAIQLAIPMVVSGHDSEVLAKVTKANDLSKTFDLPSVVATHSPRLTALITEASLVKNNGRGQMKIQLQLGSTGMPASIWAVIAANADQTLSLEQIRQFEDKVKPF